MTAENVITLPTRPERIRLDCAPSLYPPVLIPPGEYELGYVGHKASRQFKRGVLACYFVVIDLMPETYIVTRFYPIDITGPRAWKAKRGSVLVTEFRRLFRRSPPRLDRIPLSWLGDQHVIGEVVTVPKDYRQQDLDGAEYSKVGRLSRCV